MPIGTLQKTFVPSEYIFESTPLIGKKSSGLGVMVSIFFPKKYTVSKFEKNALYECGQTSEGCLCKLTSFQSYWVAQKNDLSERGRVEKKQKFGHFQGASCCAPHLTLRYLSICSINRSETFKTGSP